MRPLFELRLHSEREAVAARQSARDTARLLGFEHPEQIRIATAVSELVRAALGDDEPEVLIEFLVTREPLRQRLVVRVTSPQFSGTPGENAASARADGRISAQRLLERFEHAEDTPRTIALAKALPTSAQTIGATRIREIRSALAGTQPAAAEGYLTELRQQNRDLSSTLFELERKQEELTRLNAELADTNRGVMALYAELDERATRLRRADEIKTQFLSNMSHEFRTPLNSIRTLAQILGDQIDGPLNAEQLRQVQLIHGASAEMLELVNDLLDLAKVESGKTMVDVGPFTVASVFGVLRGMMRPLLRTSAVSLTFSESTEVPTLFGDEGKVARILRNFLSNAVKFTEQGAIDVTAEHVPAGAQIPGTTDFAATESVVFCVADTGIGIGPEDQAYIFAEFTQVQHELQRKTRGTGLGLPLCRDLATLLGGRVWVRSQVGAGSQFSVLVPRFFVPSLHARPAAVKRFDGEGAPVTARLPVLCVSEIDGHRRMLEELFSGTAVATVCLGVEAIRPDYVAVLGPTLAIIDVSPEAPVAQDVIDTMAAVGVPILEVTDSPDATKTTEATGSVLGAIVAAGPTTIDESLVNHVYRDVLRTRMKHILIVDDDERFRSILLKYIQGICPHARASADPHAALQEAVSGRLDGLVLDLIMPELDGFGVLAHLRENPRTACLPVLACSSKALTAGEHRRLLEMYAPFISKSDLDSESILQGLTHALAWGHSMGRAQRQPAGTETR